MTGDISKHGLKGPAFEPEWLCTGDGCFGAGGVLLHSSSLRTSTPNAFRVRTCGLFGLASANIDPRVFHAKLL